MESGITGHGETPAPPKTAHLTGECPTSLINETRPTRKKRRRPPGRDTKPAQPAFTELFQNQTPSAKSRPGTSPIFITHRSPTPRINLIRPAIIAGLILTFLVSLAAYPVLPDQIITHWNAAGVPDGSMGKPAGIGLVPLITVALVALLLFLPRIDPLRKNYAAFRDGYDGFILAFVLFMLAVQCQVVPAWRDFNEKAIIS